MGDLLERVARHRPARRRRRAARRPALGRARLDLPARRLRRAGGAGRVRALHVDYGLRGAASDADASTARALCERLGVALEVRRAGARRAATLQALGARRALRGRRAARRAGAGARLAAGHTVTDQVETILYRLAVSPGRRALLGMEAATGRLSGRCSAVDARSETAAWCRGARPGAGARTPPTTTRLRARPRARRSAARAARGRTRAAEANILRTARAAARRGRGARRRRSPTRSPAAIAIAVARAARAAAGARRGSSCAGWPRTRVGGLCAARGDALDDVLALADDGALDVGDGARARSSRGGVLRFGRTPARAAGALACPVLCGTPRSARSSSSPTTSSSRVRELGAQISRDYAGRDLLLVGVLKGAVFFLADLMRHIDIPCEVDFMAVASYGSATDSSRRRADPQGPRRGRSRAATS